jgi:hypothetical protein
LASAGGYLRAALRPIRTFNAWLQEVGFPIIGLVGFYLIGVTWGWSWAALALVAVLAALLWIEGARREHDRRSIDLTFSTYPFPERLPTGLWKVAIKVTNNGADREFVACCPGQVKGLARGDSAEDFGLAWEGRFEEALLLRRGWPEAIPLAYIDAPRRRVRFALPPTTYSGKEAQSVSPEKVVGNESMSMWVEVHAAQGEGCSRRQVIIRLPGGDVPPDVTVCDLPYQEH